MRMGSAYPVVRQYDQLDCGPAALLSVLRYYRGDTTLVHARQLCRTDIQGTTMLDMVQAAREMGFVAYGARGSFDELAREKMPCIAHILLPEGVNHFLVIYKIKGDRLFVGDPGKGRYYLSRSDFEKMWRQHAVILLRPNSPPEGIPAAKAALFPIKWRKSPRPDGLLYHKSSSWLRWISGYLLKQQAWLQQILFTGLLYTGAGLLVALFVQTLIDRLIPAKNLDKLLFAAAALMLMLALRAAVGYLRDRFLVVANKRLSLEVTGDFLIHLFRLPKSFFDTRKIGDITARIDDSLRIHRTCLLLMQSVLLDLLIALGALLFMFYFSLLLGTLILVMLPFYTAVLWRQARRLKKRQREVMQSHAAVASTYIDSIQGMPEIMSFNAAPAFTRLNQGMFGNFQEQIERLGLMQAGLTLAVGLLGAFISVILLAAGAWQVIAGELLLGQFMAAWSLLSYILPAVTTLVGGFVEFQGAEVAAQRLMDLLLVETEAGLDAAGERTDEHSSQESPGRLSDASEGADKHSPQKISARLPDAGDGADEHASPKSCDRPSHAGDGAEQQAVPLPCFRVENLAFAWPKSPPLLREVTMILPSGRITGLWGASGAGKSTLVQLLQRKYMPLSGSIYIDETPIDRLNLGDLRARMGVVPQQIKIFNATLAENLLLGRPAASVEEIILRLDGLGLRPLLERFNHGLATLLGDEGRKLSGGETQLLGLARALYGQPQLLIIDEGFSAIDVDLEKSLAGIISAWASRHAVLLITHNLDSLRGTEYIYLLREGRIEEEGPPQELLDAGGLFQQLVLTKNRAAYTRIGRTA